MELPFARTNLKHYVPLPEGTDNREETLEMIVPDACPDIAQIADTCGYCSVTRKELTDSGVLLSGMAHVTILYLPEVQGDQRSSFVRLEAELPFQFRSEQPDCDASCLLHASVRILSADTRVMNPRKVLVRVNLQEKIRLFHPEMRSLCSEIQTEPEQGIQQKSEAHTATYLMEPAGKVFTLEETVSVAGSRGGGGEILRARPEVICSEARLIGSKLVIKGSVLLHLLCREEESCYASECEVPFSQILDAVGAVDTTKFDIDAQVLSCQLGELSSDGRTLSMSAELELHAVYYESAPAAIISDAYSIYYPMTLQREQLSFHRLEELHTQRQSMREFVETAEAVHAVLDRRMELGQPQLRREGDRWSWDVPVTATVLYQGENTGWQTLRHSFSVQYQQTANPGERLYCAGVTGQLEALTAASGLELRGALLFRIQVWQDWQAQAVCGGSMDCEHRDTPGEQPSVVLRRPEKGENLWSIAKHYRTTTEEICRANSLSEDTILSEQMLLIPRKR